MYDWLYISFCPATTGLIISIKRERSGTLSREMDLFLDLSESKLLGKASLSILIEKGGREK
jgi:hypothetical protein